MKVYAYFGCPDTANENEIYCCGLPTEQYCCTFQEYEQQTRDNNFKIWARVAIGLIVLVLIVPLLVAVMACPCFTGQPYPCPCPCSFFTDTGIADTVVYSPPVERLQLVETTTIIEEKSRSRRSSSSSDGQPVNGAAQDQLGSKPPPYTSEGVPSYQTPGAGVPMYPTPGAEVPAYQTPGAGVGSVFLFIRLILINC